MNRIIRGLRSLGPKEGAFSANVWEDICVQVQGEESAVWHIYEGQIDALAMAEVTQLTDDERALLWVQTDNGFDWSFDHFGSDTSEEIPANAEDLVLYLAQEVKDRAADYSNRRIERMLEREHD